MQRLCLQYIGDASRTLLEKRLSEHKNAAKKHDTNNGLQPTLGNNQYHVDWRLPRQKEEWEKTTGKKRTGTPHIHQQQHTSNLKCGLAIDSWLTLLDNPACS